MSHRLRRRVAGVLAATLSFVVSVRAEPPETAKPKVQPLPVPVPVPASAPAEALVAPPLVTSRLARDAVSAAFRAAGYAEVRRDLASMATRARSAAALPEVWLRAARTTDDTLRLAPTASDPNSYTQDGGAGWWLEARLVWHLDRLVFDRDEISVERLRGERSDAAAKLAVKVLDALFAWQRATRRAKDPKSTSDEQEAAVFARAEAEVVLDVLTNGWFSEEVTPGAKAEGKCEESCAKKAAP